MNPEKDFEKDFILIQRVFIFNYLLLGLFALFFYSTFIVLRVNDLIVTPD